VVLRVSDFRRDLVLIAAITCSITRRTQQEDDPDLILSAPFSDHTAELPAENSGATSRARPDMRSARPQLLNALGEPSWPLARGAPLTSGASSDRKMVFNLLFFAALAAGGRMVGPIRCCGSCRY